MHNHNHATTPKTIVIKQTTNGGWYAINANKHTENTLHYIRKSKRGAIGHAKRIFGNDIIIVDQT